MASKIDCKECAVKLLAVKDRTEKELRDKLVQKGYEADEIDGAVEFMANYGYINDRAYAEKYLSDGINLRGHGEGRIKLELLRRGVSRETVEEVIAENMSFDASERIAEVLDRRFADADMGNPKERNRIFAYFARRGYRSGDIRSAMNSRSAFRDIEWEDEP